MRRAIRPSLRALPAVGILTRAPAAGRSKRRLAAAIGDEAAAQLAEAMLLDTAAALRNAARWRTVLFVEPATAATSVAALTGIGAARGQSGGSIGARMLAAGRALRREGHEPVILVGSDIPTLGASHVREALAALGESEVVFGPARDGGYYLIGFWEPPAPLFDDGAAAWGGDTVLAASERRAAALGLRTARIRPEVDVDTPAALAQLWRRRSALAGSAGAPRHTLAALASIPFVSDR